MTFPAFSDNWLTDEHPWEEGEVFDAPWLPGVRVRVLKCTPVQWDERPRSQQKIWIGETMSVVLTVAGKMFCSDHDQDCDCKRIAKAYMESK